MQTLINGAGAPIPNAKHPQSQHIPEELSKVLNWKEAFSKELFTIIRPTVISNRNLEKRKTYFTAMIGCKV
jgi:hypothetical protein